MNYLRGAVSAISAPYQYYKDLNPSTLTGAIDVIVVKRPVQDHDHAGSSSEHEAQSTDDHELVCSPFHVRFGKWQVLRPGDKKVNVFVNGKPVPFQMKIGEAGEAFFVFETDEDIPDNLVTSPLLQATKPGQSNADVQRTGRFGAKIDADSGPDTASAAPAAQEPDFLDLNAAADEGEPQRLYTQADQDDAANPSLLTRTAQLGKAVIGAAVETERAEKDKLKDKTVKEAIEQVEQDQEAFLKDKAAAGGQSAASLASKGDEALPQAQSVQGPDVVYTDDMVFDMEGYHSHQHNRSDESHHTGSSTTQASSQPSSPGPSRAPSPSNLSARMPFPSMRAASEPPEVAGALPTLTLPATPLSRSPPSALRLSGETEEYMWEWGSFPQRTPVRSMFAVPNGKGNGSMDALEVDTNVRGRSPLVTVSSPLVTVSSPLAMTPESAEELSAAEDREAHFGDGGRLTVDRRDPTRFRVSIERRVVDFELSVVEGASRHRQRAGEGPLGGEDEVVDAQRFEQGKVDWQSFLDDERIVRDDDLVLKWAGDMYITRVDGSPLMEALVLWREAALQGRLARSPSRSPSPGTDYIARLKGIEEEERHSDDERRHPDRAATDMSDSTVKASEGPARPSSSSWVRWWSRSRRAETAQRPDLRPMNTAPSSVQRSRTEMLEKGPLPVKRSSSVASAPVVPRSPEPESPASDVSSDEEKRPTRVRKRYAKTLRLTSEQLKSLDLKPGANTITFSLSATGAVACTARLFVWDHTDQVVISDIDGTITKSDALGHVFTMIGRDWTHLGVAKLYTDICRNGYKILYLTSRAIGQADSTRDYLKGVRQNDYQLPEGPVIMSPDRLLTSLHREVIMRKPEVFKMAALRDIQKLFGNRARNPFYAGFGNRITDALSYRSVNVPSSRIFTIDSTGEVKMELLELAGYKSSYIHMADLVDQMFPPINRKWASEYTDFNYWKQPMQEFALPDLSPPSPALSARSDTSNQSTLARLRHFSLGGGRQANNMSKFALPPPATEGAAASLAGERKNEAHLRQMSSFERLSSTLAGFASVSPLASPRSSSPTFIDSGSEDEDDEADLEKQKKRKWKRRESMPGSLPGSDGSASDDEPHFEVYDDGGEYEYHGQSEEQAAEEAFDEDFLATGEMENVPFL
ncbi:LNS2-domain-containing protein [Wolfiporia cocos MD-104 SS10]|uniref:phosphatidate phosphatase n=1 Tax=Wolfiporia cocos (strain MD-104) TaxID=742152 RepID=A0A2H3JXC7_WOLCO|nr:LNS2-domain-containing protein [Wolfiporia cocos MD-104 SS10]